MWQCSLRVRPYRTNDDKIDGTVITLVDIDGKQEQATEKKKHSRKGR